jgi:predicted MFS family arabinose efflux permease
MASGKTKLPRRAVALVAISVVARLPVTMLSILLLVHTQRLSGSFALAGAVTAAYTVGRGIGGPMLGRLADRRGQTLPLIAGAITGCLVLLTLGLIPRGASHPMLIALAAIAGFAVPPLNGCVRALLPELVDSAALPTAYAIEASAVEFAFIFGPPLALGLGEIFSTRVALAIAGFALLAGTIAFALQPSSRRVGPVSGEQRPRGGALRSPGLRTLVWTFLAVGAVFGATEVGVAAAAKALGSTSATGPLLGLWGAGSLLGGIVMTRLGRRASGAAGVASILGLLAAGHGALVVSSGSIVAMAIGLTIAGLAISPAYGSIYALVERHAASDVKTEAFSWLATAVCVGSSAGTALAGDLAQHAGPTAAFALGGATGAVAVLITLARARTLAPQGVEPSTVASLQPAVA